MGKSQNHCAVTAGFQVSALSTWLHTVTRAWTQGGRAGTVQPFSPCPGLALPTAIPDPRGSLLITAYRAVSPPKSLPAHRS